MADKHGESESFKLRTEIGNLASKRLEAICSKSRREEIFKVLSKRRKKWRRRHGHENTSCKPVDPSLREEKESLSDELVELKDALVRRRKEAFSSARQLQRERDSLCVQILSSRLEAACARLSSITSCTAAEGTSQLTTKEQSSLADVQETLTKDLESVIARATTLSEIRSMKFGMTPRVPPLHKRTLTSNPLEQSLHLFRGSEDLCVSSVTNVTTTDEYNIEEVGVGQSWASFEGLATGSTSNGLSNLRGGGTRDLPCGENEPPDRKTHTPDPLDNNNLSSPNHTGVEEILACDLQVVREEQVPAVAHTVEGTLEGLSYVTTLSHWHTTPPPQDTDTEEREEEEEEVMEEEEVVTQTTDISEEDKKLIEVLRNIERSAPWELRSRKKRQN